MVSATEPIWALPVSAKLAVLVPLETCVQQYGTWEAYWLTVSSEGLTTPLAPWAAGDTCGALTAGWTEPPTTWLTVFTDTG